MGLVMALSALPTVLLGPLGGAMADRRSRRAIVLASDLLSGVAVLSLAGLLFWRPEAADLIVLWLLAVVVVLGAAKSFFQPAVTASLPDFVAPEQLAAANSWMQLSAQVSVFVGQGLGGVLFRVLGAPLLVLIDGLTYLFSAASEAFIRWPEAPVERSEVSNAADLRGAMAEAWRFVRDRPGMRELMVAASAINFFVMPVIVLLPFYAAGPLEAGPAWYGFLLAALSTGSVVGYAAAALIGSDGRRRLAAIVTGLIGTGLLLALLSLIESRYLALVVIAGAGCCIGVVNTFALTLFQTLTPADMRGRVLSLLLTLSGAVAPLGMLLGGVLGDLVPLPFVFAGSGLSAACVSALAVRRREVRGFLATPLTAAEPVPA
jgi:MFS family permease